MHTVSPGKVGLSAPRLARIEAHMQRQVDQQKYAGILTAIARHGQRAYVNCVGMLDRDAGKPMQFDTIFRIASMTKPVTSVAVMMLYEEGHFLLNTPVSAFIPEFKGLQVLRQATTQGLDLEPAEREMTIRDLLTHTSGLSYGFLPQGDPIDALYTTARPMDATGTLKTMIVKLGQLPLAYHPGRQWRYSIATDVLGYLVEVVSGQTFDQFLERRLFEPLGMTDTGFYVPPDKLDRLMALYGPTDGGLAVTDAPATSPFARPKTFLSGGGGLVSTASDYLRFAQMLLNQGVLDGVRLLSRKTVELMMTNHLPQAVLPIRVMTPMPGIGFGLGGSVVMDIGQMGALGSVGTYSWGGAYNTIFWIDPQEDLIGLLMTQYALALQPIRYEFSALVYQAIDD